MNRPKPLPYESSTLGRVVREHAHRFPWYGNLIRETGAVPEDLGSLPLIDQPILEQHYYKAPNLPGSDVYLTSGTSGGARKRIQYTQSDDDAYIAQRSRLFADFLAGFPEGAVAVADLGTGHAAASARRTFLELRLDARDIEFTAPIADHVTKLNAWQPDVLFTMPMILDQLLHASPPLNARPRKVIVVGDLAPPAWRSHVAARFGIAAKDVLDIVGSIELGAIAYLDIQSGRYVFHDHIYAEVLSPPHETDVPLVERDRRPHISQGDGVLVLTSLCRDYFPAIRYVTGDLVSGLTTSVIDDRAVTTCDRFLGRASSDFKHGERLSPYDLSQAVAQVFPGRPFEASDHCGRLTVRVVAEHVTDTERRTFNGALRAIAPDVAIMVDAGLVPPVDVVPITIDGLKSGPGKRRFNLTEV